jgi:hypothetical protein
MSHTTNAIINGKWEIIDQVPEKVELSEVLPLFETTKLQRQEFATSIIQRIENGEVNALEIHLQLKAMEDIITQLTSTDEKKNKNVEGAKKFRDMLMEAHKNFGSGAKTFEFHNAKFTQMEAGSKWHYENCEDPVLTELINQQEAIKGKVDERQKFLQNVPESGMPIITADGEAVTVFRPYKTSTTTISVTLK